MSYPHYLESLKVLLKVIHYPHIEITSDANLNEMIFKSGNARLEILRWLFCQIDEDAYFSDGKLKEELLEFATCFGFCTANENKSLVWGVPESSGKRQFEFWTQVIETVRDVRNFRQQQNKRETEQFLREVVTSRTLEHLVDSSCNINICPSLINLDKLSVSDGKLSAQRDNLRKEEQAKRDELSALNAEICAGSTTTPASVVSKIDQVLSNWEESKQSLKSMKEAVPQEMSSQDLRIKTSMDQAVQSNKGLLKIVEGRKVLTTLTENPHEVLPVPVAPPTQLIHVIENNFKE